MEKAKARFVASATPEQKTALAAHMRHFGAAYWQRGDTGKINHRVSAAVVLQLAALSLAMLAIYIIGAFLF